MRSLRSLTIFAALGVASLVSPEQADARFGGVRDIRAVALAQVLPQPAASQSTSGAPAAHTVMAQAGSPATHAGTLNGLSNRHDMFGGFAAGFLGAGLLGLVFGHGMFGALGGMASLFGLLFQFALVALLGWLVWMQFRRYQAAAYVGLSPRQQAEPYLRSRNELLPGVYPLGGQQTASDSEARVGPSRPAEPAQR
jgi:predicted lipid-binding transport protein (Tim44 family)